MKNRVTKVADLFLGPSRLFVIQEPLRDLIEEFEPGVHQIWPVEVRMPNGSLFGTPCYGLRIAQYFDSLILEKSALERRDIATTSPELSAVLDYGRDRETSAKRKYRLTVNRAKRGGAHLWMDRLSEMHFMMSDELAEAFRARGLKTVKLHRVSEE